MIKLIVFDFDGVILDSTEEKLMHFAEEMKAFNKSPEEARKAMLDSFGQPFNAWGPKFLKEFKDEKVLMSFWKKWNEWVISSKFPFVKGTKKFLEFCRGKKRLMVFSGVREDALKEQVKNYGIEKYFEKVRGGPDKKSDSFRKLFESENINSEEVLFITDAISDLNEIRPFNVHMIAVNELLDESRESGAEFVVKDLTSMIEVLKELDEN